LYIAGYSFTTSMSAFVSRLTISDGVAYAGSCGIEIPEVYQEKPSQELYINLMK
jgi:hypothetical protein